MSSGLRWRFESTAVDLTQAASHLMVSAAFDEREHHRRTDLHASQRQRALTL
jgi:hypothetical protein